MILGDILRAAHRTLPSGAPPREEKKTVEIIESAAETIRGRIAVLRGARSAHAEVVSGRDKADAELQALVAERGKVQAYLVEKETEIALKGGPLPEEALPEEMEVNRLDRHIRICRTRLQDWDRKVENSRADLQPLINDVEEAWNDLGSSTAGKLLENFRDAAKRLADAWCQMRAFISHFGAVGKTEYTTRWPWLASLAPIQDPVEGTIILNRNDELRPEKWTVGARELLAALSELRAEVSAAKAD